MRKKIFVMLGILMIVLSVVLTPANNASAFTGTNGLLISATNDGLHAYMSTTVGSSPLTFSNINPDGGQNFLLDLNPKNSCVYARTIASKRVNAEPMAHYFRVMSNCGSVGGSFILYQADLVGNTTFRNKYVRTLTWNDTGTAFNDEMVEVRVIQNNVGTNEWGAYLYNFNTSTYDLIASKSGTSGNTSWSYASWTDGGQTQQGAGAYCPALNPGGVMQLRGIQKRNGVGNWTNLISTDSIQSTQTMYCYNTTGQYQATFPQPQIVKMRSNMSI